ncbi:MAG: hypothetical protein AAF565_21960 [Pseudomonadota bacterium]
MRFISTLVGIDKMETGPCLVLAAVVVVAFLTWPQAREVAPDPVATGTAAVIGIERTDFLAVISE